MTALFLMTFGAMLFVTPAMLRRGDGEDDQFVWFVRQDHDRQRLISAIGLSGMIFFVLGAALP